MCERQLVAQSGEPGMSAPFPLSGGEADWICSACVLQVVTDTVEKHRAWLMAGSLGAAARPLLASEVRRSRLTGGRFHLPNRQVRNNRITSWGGVQWPQGGADGYL